MLPTRGGVALAGLIVYVLILSVPATAPVCIVASFLMALILLNVPYAMLAVRGVTVQREHPSHVREGADLNVVLRVTNTTGSARILLCLSDRGPEKNNDESLQIPLLSGGKTETVAYACKAGRRGVYTFEECFIESSSPFGLVNARRKADAKSELVVYPLYYELQGAVFPFRKSSSGMTSAPGARAGEGASFFGLRDYRPGDPIRKIHWASSMRAGNILVKEFEEDMHSSVAIVLDTFKSSVVTRGQDSNLEVAIRVAASLANHTLVNGHPTALAYFDESSKSLRVDKTLGDFTPVLDGLARLKPSSMKPADLIWSAGSSLPRHSNLVVVLLSPDREAMEQILRRRAQGIEVMLVLAGQCAGNAGDSELPWLAGMLDVFENAGVTTIMTGPGDDIQASLSLQVKARTRIRI